ncbi:MAG: DUF177 domain-containing protein [Oscillospiraceae bacterium]
MYIDVNKLFGDDNKQTSFDFSFDLSNECFNGFSVKEPCSGTITVTSMGDILALSLEANAEICAECARCLAPVVKTFKIKRNAEVKAGQLQSDEEDLPFTEDDKLDVKELVSKELFSRVPTVLLCSDDCKGLCPVCGRNKADGCDCDKNVTDERFAVLKQLLNDSEHND